MKYGGHFLKKFPTRRMACDRDARAKYAGKGYALTHVCLLE